MKKNRGFCMPVSWGNKSQNRSMKSTKSVSSLHASVDFIPVVDEQDTDDDDDDEENLNRFRNTKIFSIAAQTDDTFAPENFGIRHSMILIGTLGVIVLNMMRTNFSMAIVAMVTTKVGTNDGNALSSVNDTCPAPVKSHATLDSNQVGEFHWDEREQGLLLGAYFYGNFVTNLFGGRVSEYIGGRIIFGGGIFVSAIFTILSPLAARESTNLFFAVRLLTGVSQGLSMPALTRCLVTWVPPHERSRINTIVFSGIEIGTMISLALGGWLCQLTSYGGWTLVFYIFGILGVLWTLIWFLVTSERPEDHPRISAEEKDYILSHCKLKRGKPISVPWMAVLTSVPLWSVFIMHMGYNWGYLTMLTLLPSYLSNIQHFDLKNNGLLSALPYLTKWIFANVYGFLMNKLIASNKMSNLTLRRISMLLGCYIPAIGLVILTMTGCDQTASVTILVVTTMLSGTVFCGYFCSHQDLCPNLAGTLFGVSNFLANTMGFFAPAAAGTILYNNQTLTAWSKVFYITAFVYVLSSTIYALFVSVEVQPFNEPKNSKGNVEGEDEKLKPEKI